MVPKTDVWVNKVAKKYEDIKLWVNNIFLKN